MVDIIIGTPIPPVQNNQQQRGQQHHPAPKGKVFKERRKNKEDRRSTVRSGVIVTLSTYPDRRKTKDRRKSQQ